MYTCMYLYMRTLPTLTLISLSINACAQAHVHVHVLVHHTPMYAGHRCNCNKNRTLLHPLLQHDVYGLEDDYNFCKPMHQQNSHSQLSVQGRSGRCPNRQIFAQVLLGDLHVRSTLSRCLKKEIGHPFYLISRGSLSATNRSRIFHLLQARSFQT